VTAIDGRRSVPRFLTRTMVMLAAVAAMCVVSLGAVNLVTHRDVVRDEAVTREAGASVAAREGEERRGGGEEGEEWSREPQVVAGLGDFAVQILLVAGIAFVGRKFLKIRL
jgi:hypothetical protein